MLIHRQKKTYTAIVRSYIGVKYPWRHIATDVTKRQSLTWQLWNINMVGRHSIRRNDWNIGNILAFGNRMNHLPYEPFQVWIFHRLSCRSVFKHRPKPTLQCDVNEDGPVVKRLVETPPLAQTFDYYVVLSTCTCCDHVPATHTDSCWFSSELTNIKWVEMTLYRICVVFVLKTQVPDTTHC